MIMGMRSKFYESYMQSDAWKEKKRQRFLIDDGKCVMCGRPVEKCLKPMQCHHVTYKRLGNEDVYLDLVTLCASCHIKIHRYYDRIRSKEDDKRSDGSYQRENAFRDY